MIEAAPVIEVCSVCHGTGFLHYEPQGSRGGYKATCCYCRKGDGPTEYIYDTLTQEPPRSPTEPPPCH